MIDIFLPEFTNVPATNWRALVHAIKTPPARKTIARRYRPIVLTHELKQFIIMSPRIGVLQTDEEIQWLHICKPVKLAKAINEMLIANADDPWYDFNWRYSHFNPLPDPKYSWTREWKCWRSGCYYRLTKAEIMLVKAAILEMRT